MKKLSAEAIVKQQAREILKHNYPKAIIALLIMLLPLYMIDGTTTVISCAFMNLIPESETAKLWIYSVGYPVEFIAGFLLSPVINGYIRAYYRCAYTKDMDLKDVFYYFENGRYIEALSFNIRFILRMLIPTILLYLPLIAFEIISTNIGGDFYGGVFYRDIYFLLAVLSTIAVTFYALKYFTVFTACVDKEELNLKNAVEYSKFIMKNQTGSAAKLILSFTPWLLLCMLILPMLYVIPYMTQSLCVAAKWMTQASFEEY